MAFTCYTLTILFLATVARLILSCCYGHLMPGSGFNLIVIDALDNYAFSHVASAWSMNSFWLGFFTFLLNRSSMQPALHEHGLQK